MQGNKPIRTPDPDSYMPPEIRARINKLTQEEENLRGRQEELFKELKKLTEKLQEGKTKLRDLIRQKNQAYDALYRLEWVPVEGEDLFELKSTEKIPL